MKANYFVLIVLLISVFLLNACSKQRIQTIVTRDSSDQTGRLFAEVLNNSGDPINNASVSLFISYEDVKKGLALYSFNSNNQGKVDFGFVLTGNYYLTAIDATLAFKDTTVAQVVPQRTITRKLIVK
jgi:hypothetical protein